MTTPIAPSVSFASTLARTEAPTSTPSLPSGGVARPEGPSGLGFAERVEEMVQGVNDLQVRAQDASEAYASGERNDMHGTMIALEQADISFRLVSNIRSRLVDAYREVMRMGS